MVHISELGRNPDWSPSLCSSFLGKQPHQSSKTHSHFLSDLLQTPDQPNDTRSSLLAKHYYRSCMDEKTLEKLGLDPLRQIIKSFGGWPLLEGQNWTETGYDWMTNNAKIYREVKRSPIMDFHVLADYKNNSVKTPMVSFWCPGPGSWLAFGLSFVSCRPNRTAE